MAAISDSSPLILFAKIGRLDLLHRIFDEIVIPEAVHQEVVRRGAGRAGVDEIAGAPWMQIRRLASPLVLQRLPPALAQGEREAIALAVELDANIPTLLDDRRARRTARDLGVHVLGSAGLCLLAKEQQMISEVGPLLDALRGAGLYLGERDYRAVITLAGESFPNTPV